jgi:branched-chain amino acid aminotransferase
MAGHVAHEHGASQVLFLDVTDTYLEEAGAMNHFHVTRKGELFIPTFTETILRSITSESVIELGQRELGVDVKQARIPAEQFLDDVRSGAISEAGGFGTAAVVSAVGTYVFDDATELRVGDGRIGPHTRRVYEVLTGIQRGKRKAPEGWLFLAARLEATRKPKGARAKPAKAAPKARRKATSGPSRSASAKSARRPARRRSASRSRR